MNDCIDLTFPKECGWTSEKDMAAKIKNTLKTLHDVDYEKIASQTLWGIRIMIFVKMEHVKKISHIQCAQVKTGIGNALGKEKDDERRNF